MGLDKLEKKVADHYNKDHPAEGQAQQPQQPQQQAPPPPQPQQQQQAPPAQEHHHHGAGLVKGLGNAAVFGAGATAGADAVNGLIGR